MAGLLNTETTNPLDPLQQKSAFGAKPQHVDTAVPGEQEQIDLAQSIEAQPGASIDVAPLEEVDEFAEYAAEPVDEFSEFAAEQEPTVRPEDIEREPGFLEANLTYSGFRRTLEDYSLRTLKNVAETPERQKASLIKSLGMKNVKPLNDGKGGFLIRREGEKKFHKLDPATFEIFGDLFLDWQREAVEGTAGILGAVKSPGSPSAGFGLGVFAGANLMDIYGDAIGVVRPDEEELGTFDFPAQRVKEAAAKGAAAAAFDKGLRFIGGKITNWWAGRQAIKKLESTPPSQLLADDVQNNLKHMNELAESGILPNIPGTEIPLMAHQQLPNLSSVNKVTVLEAGSKAFQKTQALAERNIMEVTTSIMENAANLVKGRLGRTLKTGSRIDRQKIAGQTTDLIDDVIKAEGEMIHFYRDKASSVGRSTPMPAKATTKAFIETIDTLGAKKIPSGGYATDTNGNLIFGSIDDVMQTLGTESKSFAQGFLNDVNVLQKQLQSGGITIDQFIKLSGQIGKKNKAARRIGGNYKAFIGKISSSLRKDTREALGQEGVLSAEHAAAYLGHNSKFANTAAAREQLSAYLEHDLGANTFVRGLVNKGKQGLANMKAMRDFLADENPKLWQKINSEFMEELVLSTRDKGEFFVMNPGKILSKLDTLGPAYLKELFPNGKHIAVRKTLHLANQVKNASLKGSEDAAVKMGQKALSSSNKWTRNVNTIKGVLHMGGSNSRMLKLVSRRGVEEFLELIPAKQRGPMRQALNNILALAKANGQLGAAADVGQAGVGTVLRKTSEAPRAAAAGAVGQFGADVFTDRRK